MPTVIIKIRRDIAANWLDANPVLALGEAAYETDTRKMKVGNGTDLWENLEYIYTHESEDLQDQIASLLTAGTGITLDYDDDLNELHISKIPYEFGYGLELVDNTVSYTGTLNYQAGDGLEITNGNLISFTGLPQFQGTYTGTINSTHNNWNPNVTAQTIRVTGDNGFITGLDSSAYQDSIFINVGNNPITIKHDHSNSEITNRLHTTNNTDYIIPPSGGSVRIIRDFSDNIWRVLGFDPNGSVSTSDQQVYTYGPASFVLVYDTSKITSTSVVFPIAGTSPDLEINWGDGSVDRYNSTGLKSHTYANNGVYVVQATGHMTSFDFRATTDQSYSKTSVVKCLSFGNIGLTSIDRAFYSCSNLNEIPALIPSTITSMQDTLHGCSSLNDQNISTWSTANVTNIVGLFKNASSINQNIGSWSTYNITSLNSLFDGASQFNSSIYLWNTSNVTSLNSTFKNATSFNQVLSTWDVSRVSDMSYSFANAESFNKDLLWTTNACTTMKHMFSGAVSFDSDITSTFNTNNVTDFAGTFAGALSFNQDVSSWDVSSATTMAYMFDGASSFDQDLTGWDITGLTTAGSLQHFMRGVTLSTNNYDNLLNYWNTNKLNYRNNLVVNFGLSQYTSSASSARSDLISYGWAITDGGLSS